jgi:hypothetical protein
MLKAGEYFYNLHSLKDIVNLPEMYCKQDFGWYGINGQNVKYAIVTYEKEFFELAKKTIISTKKYMVGENHSPCSFPFSWSFI